MKGKIVFPFIMFIILSIAQGEVYAEAPNGTYSIDYQVLHADNDSASIANDYFEKPAILIVENEEKYIQFTLNHSEWIKELQAPSKGSHIDVDVVSENKTEDTRMVQFKVEADFAKPLTFKMHTLIESMEPVYDHQYTVRFDFDTELIQEIDPVALYVEEDNREVAVSTSENDSGQKKESSKLNLKAMFVFVMILLVVLMLRVLRERKRNQSKKVK